MNKISAFKTPILLVVFNRPSVTKTIFNQIRKIKPKYLFVAADGPRPNKEGEESKCFETRKITENINWDCKVKRLYRKNNLGCGKGVSSAIEWFFENVEEGIILEDDCLPDKSFFDFCQEMLSVYKKNDQVMLISGDNFLPHFKHNSKIHYLSRYVHIWGWATWKDRWKEYDFRMSDWSKLSLLDKFKYIDGNMWEKIYWMSAFESVANKHVDTWDYQWVYSIMKNKANSVVPGTNLITNLGFNSESTHTKSINPVYSNLRLSHMEFGSKLASNRTAEELYKYEIRSVFKFKSVKTLVSFIYYVFVIKLFLKFKK